MTEENVDYVKRLKRMIRHNNEVVKTNLKLKEKVYKLEKELQSTRLALIKQLGFNK